MQAFTSLMYHNVTDDGSEFPDLSPSVTSYFVDQRAFASQIEQLGRVAKCLNWSTVRQFYEADAKTTKTDQVREDRPRVQLTFDDGWLGSVDVAGPILETHRCEAMLFVTTDLVGRRHFLGRRELQHLPPTFRIGSHARTHRLLSELSEDDVREELQSSKHFLEDAIGDQVDTLSIPGGAVDERVRRIASDVGYRFLFTSQVQANTRQIGPMNIGRIAIRRKTTLRDFQRYLRGDFGRERLRQNLLQSSKQLIGPKLYERVRRQLLGESHNERDMLDLTASDRERCETVEVHYAE